VGLRGTAKRADGRLYSMAYPAHDVLLHISAVAEACKASSERRTPTSDRIFPTHRWPDTTGTNVHGLHTLCSGRAGGACGPQPRFPDSEDRSLQNDMGRPRALNHTAIDLTEASGRALRIVEATRLDVFVEWRGPEDYCFFRLSHASPERSYH